MILGTIKQSIRIRSLKPDADYSENQCLVLFFLLSYFIVSSFLFFFSTRKKFNSIRGHTIIKRRNNLFIYLRTTLDQTLAIILRTNIDNIFFSKNWNSIIEKNWDNYPIITFSKLIDNHPDNFSCHDDIPPEIRPIVKSDNLLFHSHLNSRKV